MHARPFSDRRILRHDVLLLSLLFSWGTVASGAAPEPRNDDPAVGCGKAQAAMRAAHHPRVGNGLVLDQLSDTDILHHAVEIEVFPLSATLTGTSVMTIQSKVDGLSTFTFRLHENFQITGAFTGGGTPVQVSTIDFLTRAATLDRACAFDEILTLEIQYTGQPVSMGFGSIEFERQHGFGPDIVYTLSEPYYSGTWWPCKDGGYAEPGDNADKATIEMAVIAPAEMTTVSNGLLQGIDELSGDRRRFRWRSDYPLSTYLVCFSSTEYNTWSREYEYPGGVMPVDFYIYPMDDTSGNRAGWDRVLDMLAALASRFGEYPFVDEKYGIYQSGFGGGMEHQTMTAQGGFGENLTVHELAHQWWGDEVTCRLWNDIWLNEGFATYSEALWHEIRPGSNGLPDLLAAMDYRRPSNVGGSVYVYDDDLGDLWRIFNGSLSYRKGAWVLHQLRHIVGDDAFWDILAAYRSQYAFSGATTDEFAAVCASVFGEDLSWFFDEWVYDIGAPSYNWGWQGVEILGRHYVRLYIDQTQTNAYPRFTMPIDVLVTTASDAETHVVFNDADSEHFVIPVSDLPTSVAFDPQAWVLWQDRTQVGYVPGPPAVVGAVPAPGDVVIVPSAPLSVFVTFSSDVSAVAGDFSIEGASTGDHPFDFSYDAANFTARLDLGEMLPVDAYTVTAFDTLTALDSGDALDGELDEPDDPASLPSGDGLPGGDAVFTFRVQSAPGDGDADGDVDLFDFEMFLACTTGPGGDAPPQCAAFDIDEDGDVDFADFAAVQSLFTGTL